MVSPIELLAPAKDLACGKAAIDCGADAVYLGAPKFGARESAGNSLQDIAALVEHAHKYWARVYVTLNTLLYDDELPQAESLITELHGIGIDGLIIQDTGILELDLPPIPLIASTQMHNATPEKVAFLESVGFRRVILARELDIDQIRAIGERTTIELECFIHGALCVCYSGQCYLSYALGGRSGNRGACAQPCRKPYSLVDHTGRTLIANSHLLSLKDLNLSEHLSELMAAGVCSFKIEGRLKDQAYVRNIVAFYREKLDQAIREAGLRRSSSGTSDPGFTPDPNKTFNRDYCTHFLHGATDQIARPETPKMLGEPIGRVRSIRGRSVTLAPATRHAELDSASRALVIPSAVEESAFAQHPQLHPGDGICFFDRNGELRGTVVNECHGSTFVPDKPKGIEPGTVIYRNHDHEFLTRLAKATPRRQIAIRLTLRETNEGLELIATDEDGNEAVFSLQCEKTPAEKPDQALDNIRKQLSKTGGTDFSCAKVDLDGFSPLFIPISTLNSLRRSVLEELTRVRAANRPRSMLSPVEASRRDQSVRSILSLSKDEARSECPYPTDRLTFEGNVLNKLAEAFYRRHGVTEIEPAAESGLDLHGRRVMTTRYCLRRQLGKCGNSEPLTLIDAEGHRLELRFDCENCRMEVWLPSAD